MTRHKVGFIQSGLMRFEVVQPKKTHTNKEIVGLDHSGCYRNVGFRTGIKIRLLTAWDSIFEVHYMLSHIDCTREQKR